MSVHVLLNAASSGVGPIVAINRVTPMTVVYEFSSDFSTTSTSDPVVAILELEKSTDVADFVNTPNGVSAIGHASVAPGGKGIRHIGELDYLFVQAGFVNPPTTGTVSVRLYVPDGV